MVFFILAGLVGVCLIAILLVLPTAFTKKVRSLGGRVTFRGLGLLTYKDKQFLLEYKSRSRYSSACFKISINGIFAQNLVIRPETGKDGFAKKIGLSHEPQINDKAIDEQLYFECDAPEFVTQLFSRPGVKSVARAILNSFSSIHISPNRCAFVMDKSREIEYIHKNDILGYADKLIEFSAAIPTQDLMPHPEIARFKLWRVILYFSGYSACICGLIAWVWSMVCYRIVYFERLWSFSVCCSILLTAIAGYFAFCKIKGFSTSLRVFIHFLASFAVGILFLARYGTAVINGLYDKHPAQGVETQLIVKYIEQYRSSRSYHMIVNPWHSEQKPWHFAVVRDEYNRAIGGKTIYRINVKPGYLGWEWVLSESQKS